MVEFLPAEHKKIQFPVKGIKEWPCSESGDMSMTSELELLRDSVAQITVLKGHKMKMK